MFNIRSLLLYQVYLIPPKLSHYTLHEIPSMNTINALQTKAMNVKGCNWTEFELSSASSTSSDMTVYSQHLLSSWLGVEFIMP